MMGDYTDIIHLPHPEPKNHPRMPMEARAAQFAPFAALTGYDAVISETARLTDRQEVLDEEQQQLLNRQFLLLLEHIAEHPTVTITYFVADEKKAGGSYQSVTGHVKRYDDYLQLLIMSDGHQIPLHDIFEIKGI
ncbi:MAG: hypothetical protein J5957_13170 [Prevotella sp.]|nr:hypothetical protein [Prevotella sp.]